MKAIIHIGMPKVGSTSIQGWLKLNGTAISEQGTLYIRMRPNQSPNRELEYLSFVKSGTDLRTKKVRNIIRPERAQALPDYVEKFSATLDQHLETDTYSQYVASAEQLFRLTETQIAALHQFLSVRFDSIEYICYLRRPEDWILSQYSQSLRSGSTLTLDAYIDANPSIVDYFPQLKLWSDVCGASTMNVRLLDPEMLVGGSLLSDFAAQIGSDPLATPPRLNESLSAEHGEYGRLINVALQEKPELDKGSRRLRRIIMTELTALSAGAPKVRLTAALLQKIKEASVAPNEEIRRAFFPNQTTLYPEAEHQPVTDALTKLTPERAVEIGLDLFMNQSNRPAKKPKK